MPEGHEACDEILRKLSPVIAGIKIVRFGEFTPIFLLFAVEQAVVHPLEFFVSIAKAKAGQADFADQVHGSV